MIKLILIFRSVINQRCDLNSTISTLLHLFRYNFAFVIYIETIISSAAGFIVYSVWDTVVSSNTSLILLGSFNIIIIAVMPTTIRNIIIMQVKLSTRSRVFDVVVAILNGGWKIQGSFGSLSVFRRTIQHDLRALRETTIEIIVVVIANVAGPQKGSRALFVDTMNIRLRHTRVIGIDIIQLSVWCNVCIFSRGFAFQFQLHVFVHKLRIFKLQRIILELQLFPSRHFFKLLLQRQQVRSNTDLFIKKREKLL